ncbi:ribokinase [Anoxybacterium hadale]|uniref:Ribokinase n=1 Tax=Anoxybacterium hadale TaxID=3408580 RepID=A0ACD1ADX6_9FIRM|nr:ribokinase [Clostridiales bacterium]
MKHYDTFIIGHITQDQNITENKEVSESPGGAVFFSSYASLAGERATGILTKTAREDRHLLDAFNVPKEDLYYIPSEHTTLMRNEFFSADREKRICTALSIADPFRLEDIPEVSTKIYHLAGLVYGDFENEMIKPLSEKGLVAADMQGFLRVSKNGSMVFIDWKDKMEYLPYIHFLKTDAAEAEIMTGCSKTEEAAKIMFDWGAKEVMITHNTEVIVYTEEGLFRCPLRPRNLSGRTGRGDTCFSTYITERLYQGVKESLLYAAATVSYKMESPGPIKASRKDIEAYITEFYADEIR